MGTGQYTQPSYWTSTETVPNQDTKMFTQANLCSCNEFDEPNETSPVSKDNTIISGNDVYTIPVIIVLTLLVFFQCACRKASTQIQQKSKNQRIIINKISGRSSFNEESSNLNGPKCKICKDPSKDATWAAIPCGHTGYCKNCLTKTYKKGCKVCSKKIKNIVKLFAEFPPTQCKVCQSPNKDATWAAIPCGHTNFCEECLQTRLDLWGVCPTCQRKMDNIMKIQQETNQSKEEDQTEYISVQDSDRDSEILQESEE